MVAPHEQHERRPTPPPPAEARRVAYGDLNRAHGHLEAQTVHLLKEHGLTLPQWEALCVLRRAGSAGLPSQKIASGMDARVPDITRLVDRLLQAGHVRRERSNDDRRVMRVRILPQALDVLAALDRPIAELRDRQFEQLSSQEVRTLRRLLGKLIPRPPDRIPRPPDRDGRPDD